jgi:hypothetical protein
LLDNLLYKWQGSPTKLELHCDRGFEGACLIPLHSKRGILIEREFHYLTGDFIVNNHRGFMPWAVILIRCKKMVMAKSPKRMDEARGCQLSR